MRTTLFALACILAAACAAPASANEVDQSPAQAAAPEAEPLPVEWVDEPCPRRTFMRGHRRVVAEPRYCRTPASLSRGCAYELDVRAAARRNAMGKRARRNGIARCVEPGMDLA